MFSFESGVKVLTFINQNPTFKGSALMALAAVFVLTAFVFKKDKKKYSIDFMIFIAVALIMFIYGIYILLARPNLWVW